MVNNERVMPHSLEAEKTVLGSILLDNACVYEAQTLISADDFSLDSHRRIFARMTELERNGSAIDIVTLSEKLARKNELESIGGAGYVSSLIDGVPHQPSIRNYAEIVREKARLRSVIRSSNLSLSRAYDQESASAIIGDQFTQLSDVLQRSNQERRLDEIASSFMVEMDRNRLITTVNLGLTYSIHLLDELTTGLRPAEFVIIGGRTGDGKSALAREIARQNAIAGKKVSIFTPEMTGEQQFSLLLPKEAGVPYYKIRDPRLLSPVELNRVLEATDRLIQLPLRINDLTGITLAQLLATARMHISQGSDMCIVDYLQLVHVPGAADRYDATTKVSNGLRDLAKETKVPIIGLSQLDRPKDKRGPLPRPTIHDLKQSGDVENDAAMVLLIYREVDEKGLTGRDEIILGKQRFGESRTFVPVTLNKAYVLFEQDDSGRVI